MLQRGLCYVLRPGPGGVRVPRPLPRLLPRLLRRLRGRLPRHEGQEQERGQVSCDWWRPGAHSAVIGPQEPAGEGERRVLRAGQTAAAARRHHQPARQGDTPSHLHHSQKYKNQKISRLPRSGEHNPADYILPEDAPGLPRGSGRGLGHEAERGAARGQISI